MNWPYIASLFVVGALAVAFVCSAFFTWKTIRPNRR